jgi:hypothetical protein
MDIIKVYEEKNILVVTNPTGYSKNPIILKNKKKLINFLKTLNLVILLDEEDLEIEILKFIEILAENNIPTYISSFATPLSYYINKKYKNNKIYFSSIYSSNQFHFSLSQIENIFTQSKKRDYNLMYFGANRKPFRDLVIKFILDNNLLNDDNIIVFRNRGIQYINTMLYRQYHENGCFLDVNYKDYNHINIVHETQKNIVPWGDQRIQDFELMNVHTNSRFNILCEAVYPYENSENEILKNYTCLSKRTIFPLLFKNVIHIYPQNKPLENYLKSIGVQLFFNSDEDFLNNMNEYYYLRDDVQEKLEINFRIMQKIISPTFKYSLLSNYK